MALLMATANVFGLMALATADDNHEVIAWMTDRSPLSNSQYVSRIDCLTGTTRMFHPSEDSHNTRAAFLNVGYKNGDDVIRHKIKKSKRSLTYPNIQVVTLDKSISLSNKSLRWCVFSFYMHKINIPPSLLLAIFQHTNHFYGWFPPRQLSAGLNEN